MKKKHFSALLVSLVVVLSVMFLVGCAADEPEAEPIDPAEEYPEGTVTVIIPWGAGGRTDVAARVWAPFMEDELGVPVAISNMPGAGGVIGGTRLIGARADGHTFGVLSISLNLAQWTADPAFEFDKVEPVCQIFASPMTLAVHADSEWETLEDYLEYAKENPGEIIHSASGTGTSQHVISAAFHDAAGVEVTFVPYEGDGPAAEALATGEVNAAGSPMIALQPYIDAGEIRVLGVSSAERKDMYDDIPTFKEQGVDFALESFDGIYVPLDTPDEIIAKLEDAFYRMSENPEFVEAMENIDYEVAFIPRGEFSDFLDEINAILEHMVYDLDLVVGE